MKHHYITVVIYLLALPLSGWSHLTSAADYNGPIIDMHVHTGGVFPDVQALENPFHDKSYPVPAGGAEGHKKDTYQMFDKYNIVKAMVSGWGAAAAAWHEQDPDRVIPGIMTNSMLSVEQIRTLHAEGKVQALGEVGFYYEGLRADDEKIRPYFALAEELGIPVGYHIMPGGGPGSVYEGGMMGNIRAANGDPMQIEEVLIAHPDLKIYMMHAGWPRLGEMKALMYAHPQLYVGISAINWLAPRAEFHGFLKGLVNAGYGDRIMYGTDQMEWPAIFDDAYEGVNSASFLTDEQKADIFYNNAARFLELSDDEIEKHKQLAH